MLLPSTTLTSNSILQKRAPTTNPGEEFADKFVTFSKSTIGIAIYSLILLFIVSSLVFWFHYFRRTPNKKINSNIEQSMERGQSGDPSQHSNSNRQIASMRLSNVPLENEDDFVDYLAALEEEAKKFASTVNPEGMQDSFIDTPGNRTSLASFFENESNMDDKLDNYLQALEAETELNENNGTKKSIVINPRLTLLKKENPKISNLRKSILPKRFSSLQKHSLPEK